MLAQPDAPKAQRQYKSVVDCAQQIYARDGFKGFYRGFVPCLLRSAPTNGISFLAFELAMQYLPK